MRVLMLGDVVGRAGRDALALHLPQLKSDWALDALVINAENAAGGFGLTAAIADQLFALGADVLTLGNHSFDQRDLPAYMSANRPLVRPLNYPAGTPGVGLVSVELSAGTLVVAQIMGQLFMPSTDLPYPRLMEALEPYRLGGNAAAILVDVHAEATSEKQALAYALDGRVSAVLGTHTHVPTADARILPLGTAFQSDLGMCGDYHSVIGFTPDSPVQRLKSPLPAPRLTPALGEATLCGLLMELDANSGLAQQVTQIRLGGLLSQALPEWAT